MNPKLSGDQLVCTSNCKQQYEGSVLPDPSNLRSNHAKESAKESEELSSEESSSEKE